MKIIGFIPARYGSTRFPGKPLAKIAGKSLIQRAYECATSCPELSHVYVATDSERIASAVKDFGGGVILTKKEHRCGTDRICEAAQTLGLADEDMVINIQGDQPLFPSTLITRMIDPLRQDDTIPMSTLKFKIRNESEIHNPNHVKVVTDRNGFALYFSRCPIPFFRDGDSKEVHFKHLGFYAFRMGFLFQFARLPEGELEAIEKLEQLRALEYGFKIKVAETPHDSIEVDVPEDIRRVEKKIEKES